MWAGFKWLRIRVSGGSCEHGNKPSESIKGEEFVIKLSYYYVFKKSFVPWKYL
jgi:hypothetical protein